MKQNNWNFLSTFFTLKNDIVYLCYVIWIDILPSNMLTTSFPSHFMIDRKTIGTYFYLLALGKVESSLVYEWIRHLVFVFFLMLPNRIIKMLDLYAAINYSQCEMSSKNYFDR